MPKITNHYRGEVTLPDGKKMRFKIDGTSQVDVKKLLKEPNPKARVKFK